MKPFKLSLLALTIAGFTASVHAEETVNDKKVDKDIEVINIFGQRNTLEKATGSAFVVNQEALEQYEYDDIHRVLQTVPGVYMREEDGFGLRPNIGLRGATTERSSKVAIMEDGVLIAPAPYAAPAAYFFPLVSRMENVEVFKGPSAIKYGPNTVGGAINLVSTTVATSPEEERRVIDVSLGEFNTTKVHLVANEHMALANGETLGLLFEGIHLGSDGFKRLETGNDTGFDKKEFLFKAFYQPNTKYYQWWQVKAGYADEVSDETYLGLTDEDFASAPYLRYVASEKDQMDWEHYQFQLTHFIELSDSTSLLTQAYQRNFDRDWDRLNSFNTNRSMQTILSSPNTGINALFMEVLKGERDTLTEQEQLLFTLNDRQYYSTGIESKLMLDHSFIDFDLSTDIGLRIHQDQVKRLHRSDAYAMQNSQLVFANQQQMVTTYNKDTVLAIAGFINTQLDYDDLTLSAGMRIESIDGEANDYLHSTVSDNKDTVVLPGVGIFYSISNELGMLAGVNKGFVPNSPGQADGIDPEESWNYELGLRYAAGETNAELIGFYNDYQNLKGTCTFSSGCEQQLDQEFNGGEVDVMGLEFAVRHEFEVNEVVSLPIAFAYTHTKSEFQTDFDSTFSQWGQVKKGDELPYMPKHQASIELALASQSWRASLTAKYIGEMKEASGINTELAGFETESFVQLDFSVWHQLNDSMKLYVKLDNITDEVTVVSRRPFGARPGKPRQATLGIKYSF